MLKYTHCHQIVTKEKYMLNFTTVTETLEDSMFLSFVTIAYLLLCIKFLTYLKRKKYERTKEFMKTISIGLKNKTVDNIQDINNIYMGIFGIQCDTKDSVYCSQLCKLLRKLLVKIINNEGEIKELSFENEKRNEIKEKCHNILTILKKHTHLQICH